MAKKEQEMYEGMPVIEAGDWKVLERKLEKMAEPPEKFAVRIPKTKTLIKEWAFDSDNSRKMCALIIPDSVTDIGDYAFADCDKLTSISFSNSVVNIRGNAFRNCTALTSITLPESLEYLGVDVFLNTGITDVFIPASVKTIKSPFDGCNLKSIVISENNPVYDSRDNCNAIIETDTNILLLGCKTTIIPDSVTRIGYGAFHDCTELTSIIIPDSVTKISGFKGCTGLTSITISNSATEIGDFKGCTGLTSITIPDSVTKIDWNAFEGCTGLTSITIPDSMTEIKGKAFFGCTNLKSITIPASTEIGEDAIPETTEIIRK